MKHLFPALRILVFMTVVTGIAYPVAVTFLSQILFSHQANGSLIRDGDKVIGSQLIAQKFENPKYFWSRPSAGDYNPLPSGGSNQGQISADLKKVVDERAEKLKAAHSDQMNPPQDLLFASSSGLDPHISVEAARYQLKRVAQARGFTDEQTTKLQGLLESKIEGRQWGMFGEPRLNVLELNVALDRM